MSLNPGTWYNMDIKRVDRKIKEKEAGHIEEPLTKTLTLYRTPQSVSPPNVLLGETDRWKLKFAMNWAEILPAVSE